MIRVIGLHGKMFSGKSTVFELLCEMARPKQVKLVKFAGPLYDMQGMIYKRAYLDAPKVKDRKLLQWLGTEWGRSIDSNLWTGIWKRDANYVLENSPTTIVVSDDTRFDNEADLIRSMGGIVIHVKSAQGHREKRASALGLEITDHASEASLPADKIDIEVMNNETVTELRRQLWTALEPYRSL